MGGSHIRHYKSTILLSFIDGARDNIILLSEKNITIDIDDVEKYACKIPEGFILLKDFILDKKILNLEDTEVEVVYDIKMVLMKNKLYITEWTHLKMRVIEG